MAIGQHLLIECAGGAAHFDQLQLESLLLRAAKAGGATVLFSHFHPFGDNMGITGVLVLAESHITVHTWPELDYAAFDIFMCGECNPELAAQEICNADPSAIISTHSIARERPATLQTSINKKE